MEVAPTLPELSEWTLTQLIENHAFDRSGFTIVGCR